jgi:AraC family transcriptional regulator, transcriptional activator of pobA
MAVQSSLATNNLPAVHRLSSRDSLFGINQIPINNKESKAHSHDFYAILWFEKGKGVHNIDFKDYQVAPKRFHFFSPGKVHSMKPETPIQGKAIYFSESFLAEPGVTNPLWLEYPFFSLYGKAENIPCKDGVANIRLLIEQISYEQKKKLPNYRSALRYLLKLLLIQINRGITEQQVSPASSRAYSYYRDFCSLVNEHFIQKRNVNFYAKELGITTAHLSACVKKFTGSSASQWIRNRTVHEIKRQLSYAEQPIYKIAIELNFEDASYLSRYFKQATGVPPSEFKAST